MDCSGVKLHVVVPGDSRGPFFTYLAALIYKTGNNGVLVDLSNPRGSDLVSVRTLGAMQAIESGATHILWIDSDMIVPDDAALKLLEHNLPIVAVNYVMKRKEMLPVTSIDGVRISSIGKSGLEKVDGTGMGFMMTNVDIYHKMRFPWFGHRWFPNELVSPIGVPKDIEEWPSSFEDAYFCDRARQSEIDIYIDHDLSLKTGHYGGCVYYQQGISPL